MTFSGPDSRIEVVMVASAQERLIVALDVPTAEEALRLIRLLAPHVGLFKIGLQLYTAEGPRVVRAAAELGAEVFLDLKLHDIPNTVGSTVTEVCRLGVRMMTLHTLGGAAMLGRARLAADEQRAKTGKPSPLLLGVTVLTSLGPEAVSQLGFRENLGDLVRRLARLAQDSGLDGIVCSPQEVKGLREAGLDRLVFVTPGVRPGGSALEDQSRVSTPAQALSEGAGYLVVGRPIVRALDPIAAARAIVREMEAAMI